MAINKVVYNGGTLIDLTGDTVTADKLMQGYTAHDKSGEIIIGTATGGGSGVILFTDNNAEMLINQEIRTWTSSTDYYYKALNVGNIIANETYVVIFDDVSYNIHLKSALFKLFDIVTSVNPILAYDVNDPVFCTEKLILAPSLVAAESNIGIKFVAFNVSPSVNTYVKVPPLTVCVDDVDCALK